MVKSMARVVWRLARFSVGVVALLVCQLAVVVQVVARKAADACLSDRRVSKPRRTMSVGGARVRLS